MLLDFETIKGPNLFARFWKMQESADELESLCRSRGIDTHTVKSIHLEKRQREWMITQLLKNECGVTDEILFLPNGKPYLNNGPFISLSHGDGIAGFVCSPFPVGMDIQLPNAKIEKISSRFCTTSEITDAANAIDSLRYLTTIWCAKEAIFKIFGEHVHFAEDILITPFIPGQAVLKATIKRDGVVRETELMSKQIEGHEVAVAVLRS